MKLKVVHTDPFLEAFLFSAPLNLRKSWTRKIKPYIEERGHIPDGKSIKKLNNYKNIYRYKSGNYRFVHYVDNKNKTIYMITFGDRKDIYKKIDSILARFNKPEIIEDPKKMTYKQKPAQSESDIYGQKETDKFIDEITKENLKKWKIPVEFHALILKCVDEDEILNLVNQIPQDVFEKLFYEGKPPESSQIKTRIIPDAELENLMNDDIEVGDFKKNLFVLDREQRTIVDKFIKVKKGTWIVKGPAGTGKSIVLMSCAKALSDNMDTVPKILYTGYTRSLINSAKNILGDSENIDCLSAWHICGKILRWNSKKNGENYKNPKEVPKGKLEEVFARSLIKAEIDSNVQMQVASAPEWKKMFCDSDKRHTAFIVGKSVFSSAPGGQPSEDTQCLEFLYRELMEIVWGKSLSKKDYLHKDSRLGALNYDTIVLDRPMKELVWKFSQILDKELEKEKIFIYDPRRFYMAKQVLDSNPECPLKYDYIFFDEAQNLPQTCLQMFLSLTKNNNMLIGADESQNIYNSSFSSDDIPKKPNVFILKKQYRSTKEIHNALLGITKHSKNKGIKIHKSKDSISYGSGDIPEFFIYNRHEFSLSNKIATYIEDSIKEKGLRLSDAVIIVPNFKVGDILANELNATKIFTKLPYDQKARCVKASRWDPKYKGLNITNSYTVQGMEFPIVIVTNFDFYPSQKPTNATTDKYHGPEILTDTIQNYNELIEEQLRMFYVACSRARYKLLVTCDMGGSELNQTGDLIRYLPTDDIDNLEEDILSKAHDDFFNKVIDKKAWNFTMHKNLS